MFEKYTLQQEKSITQISLPSSLSFEANAVFVRKFGNALVLLPADEPWELFFQSLSQFSEDFMYDREQPSEEDKRLEF